MHTDFKRLNRFESALISMIVLGLVIVGFEIYAGLGASQQRTLATSLEVLDANAMLSQTAAINKNFSANLVGMYDQINLSFVQAVAIPDELNHFADMANPVISKASDALATFYATPALASTEGSVLGVSTEGGCGPETTADAAEAVNTYYSYQPLTLGDLKTLVPILNN